MVNKGGERRKTVMLQPTIELFQRAKSSMHLVGDHFFWSHFSGHLDIKLHACIQQPKQRNCPPSLWDHTSINNAQFLECHVSLYNAFKERHQVLKS